MKNEQKLELSNAIIDDLLGKGVIIEDIRKVLSRAYTMSKNHPNSNGEYPVKRKNIKRTAVVIGE